jgi:hypothetical protein
MTRCVSAVLLALGLLLTGACNSDQTGDSVVENQTDEVPGEEQEKVEESPAP